MFNRQCFKAHAYNVLLCLRISAVSHECKLPAELTFDMNVSRECSWSWSRGGHSTAHGLEVESMLCFVSKCFILLLVLPLCSLLQLRHILHLTPSVA